DGLDPTEILPFMLEAYGLQVPPKEATEGPDERKPKKDLLDLAVNTFATPQAEAIRAAATELGIDATDLATAIAYETGGSFRADQPGGGPAAGRFGLIQFGPEEARTYGASADQSFEEQMQAVVAYLKDRGLTPGMGLLDIYSTINAGRPGLYG